MHGDLKIMALSRQICRNNSPGQLRSGVKPCNLIGVKPYSLVYNIHADDVTTHANQPETFFFLIGRNNLECLSH